MSVPWLAVRNLLETAYFFKIFFRRLYILILASIEKLHQTLEMECDYLSKYLDSRRFVFVYVD